MAGGPIASGCFRLLQVASICFYGSSPPKLAERINAKISAFISIAYIYKVNK